MWLINWRLSFACCYDGNSAWSVLANIAYVLSSTWHSQHLIASYHLKPLECTTCRTWNLHGGMGVYLCLITDGHNLELPHSQSNFTGTLSCPCYNLDLSFTISLYNWRKQYKPWLPSQQPGVNIYSEACLCSSEEQYYRDRTSRFDCKLVTSSTTNSTSLFSWKRWQSHH